MQNQLNKPLSDQISEVSTAVMPTFLIIGAQKCGTTALYHYLNQHPDVFMSPVKEPNFFAFEHQAVDFYDADGRLSPINSSSVTELDSYQELFSGWNGERAVGEASPHYLYVEGSADRIKRHIPSAKLIAILRNPIDRAYSAYLHARRAMREPISDFSEALSEEQERIRLNYGYIYHYTKTGFYSSQLAKYFDTFSRDQIRVYIYDEFAADPFEVIRDAYDFIGVDGSFVPDMGIRYNASGLPKSLILHSLYQWIGTQRGIYQHIPPYFRELLPTSTIKNLTMRLTARNLYKPPMDKDCHNYLRETFQSDIEKLQHMLERDLSGWLK